VPDVSDLLAAYDEQARARVPDPLPRGVTVERDGPLLRFLGLTGRGFVVYRDLGGLEAADLDELIARQVEVFSARGERFEWKLHGHDRPKDLAQRLRAAGFVPEEIAGEVRPSEGVSLREVTRREQPRSRSRDRNELFSPSGRSSPLAVRVCGGVRWLIRLARFWRNEPCPLVRSTGVLRRSAVAYSADAWSWRRWAAISARRFSTRRQSAGSSGS
jgi:hypothetical protein